MKGSKLDPIATWIGKTPADFGQTKHSTLNWVFIPALIGQLIVVSKFSELQTTLKAAFFISGLVLWTLEEYLLHRFSFHSESEHPWIRPFNSGLHLLHHRSPTHEMYIGAPLILTIPMYLGTLAVFRMLTGAWDQALLLGCGITLGFLIYEHVHFSVHQSTPVRGRLMKLLKKHHMSHHFSDPKSQFGVTSPIWDRVFGTQGR